MTGKPLQLNCPKCPRRMEFLYITIDRRVSVYRCWIHGEWHLGPGGLHAPGEILRVQNLTETA